MCQQKNGGTEEVWPGHWREENQSLVKSEWDIKAESTTVIPLIGDDNFMGSSIALAKQVSELSIFNFDLIYAIH